MGNKMLNANDLQLSTGRKAAILILIGLVTLFNNGDTSMLGTATVSILGDIGGAEVYALMFTAKNLLNAIFLLLSGKFGDKWGRKSSLTIGIVFVLAGYIMSAFATNMGYMIFTRAITGIGSGFIMGISYVIIGDLFRGKSHATAYSVTIISSGIALIGGPTIGGLIVDNMNWQWVFWCMVPLAVGGLILCLAAVPNYNLVMEKKKTDTAGIFFFAIGMFCFMTLISLVNSFFSWASIPSLLLLIGAVVFLGLFVRREKRVKEDIAVFPMRMLKKRFYWTASVGQLCLTINSCVLMVYIPLYLQSVIGVSATESGYVLSLMYIVSTVLGAAITKLVSKNERFRKYCVLTSLLECAGLLAVTVFMTPTIPMIWVYVIVAGYSAGAALESFIFIYTIQKGTPAKKMAVGTAGISFVQGGAAMLGMAVGGTIMTAFPDNLELGLHNVFLFALIVTLVGAFLVTAFMPKESKILEDKEAEERLMEEAENKAA